MDKIDLHILSLPTRKHLLDRAVASIPNDLFNLHILEVDLSIPLGISRYQGYQKGTSEWCTFLNDDDELVSEGVKRTIEMLHKNPSAVGAFSDELVVDDISGTIRNGRSTGTGSWDPAKMFRYPSYGHQLLICKRSVIDKHMPVAQLWGPLSEYVLRCLAMYEGDWVHAPYVAYKWHIHETNSHKGISSMERFTATRFVIPVLRQLDHLR